MGFVSELYERLVRRFRKKSVSRPASLKRSQSVPREHKENRATIVLRPRSNTTEVTIERRRVSSRSEHKSHKNEKSPEKTEATRKREKMMTRTDSGNSSTSITITRANEPKKSVPSGSILAPTYRTRTTSLRQHHNVIEISI